MSSGKVCGIADDAGARDIISYLVNTYSSSSYRGPLAGDVSLVVGHWWQDGR